jgi:choline dehydrogenase-like flavoprotein
MVSRVDVGRGGKKRLASGVTFIDNHGEVQHEDADIVVLAPSPIETARLCLLSATPDHPNGLGNSSGQLGRNLMFHFLTVGVAIFLEDVHGWIGPASTFTMDDLVGPDKSNEAVAFAKLNNVPYLKGGICEVGGAQTLLSEAQFYASLFQILPSLSASFVGTDFKTLMRLGVFRDHVAGVSMVGEDMPQLGNVVDLDPKVRDVFGLPVPRITYSSHPMEVAASLWFGPKLGKMCAKAPGQRFATWIGGAATTAGGFAGGQAGPASTAHIMGTARMGNDPTTSVTDKFGRMHDLDNVYVADGSVFVTSAGANPTNTIMSLALRQARHIAAEL